MFKLQERLKLLREQNGWTKQYVADRLGVSEFVYSGYESGKKVLYASAIIKIAQLYGVSSDYLLGLKDETQIKTGTVKRQDCTDDE